MKVQIDATELLKFLKDELDIAGLKEDLKGLTKIDFNPFDEDGDEYVGFKAEMKHNGELIWNAVSAVIGVTEKVIVGGLSLNGAQKRDLAVKMLDDALKLPFFLEPFDGVALGMLVDMGVAQMNRINWGYDDPALMPKLEAPENTWKEIG